MLKHSSLLALSSTVTQLIRFNQPTTRAAIANCPYIAAEVSDELLPHSEPARLCLACDEILPAANFRRAKFTAECQHECQYFLKAAVNIQLGDDHSDCRCIRFPENLSAPATACDCKKVPISYCTSWKVSCPQFASRNELLVFNVATMTSSFQRTSKVYPTS